MDQSDEGSTGLFSRWTNQMQETRVYRMDGSPHSLAASPPCRRFLGRVLLDVGALRGQQGVRLSCAAGASGPLHIPVGGARDQA
eukprot:1496851-Pyramimonas_sp.AAC.1